MLLELKLRNFRSFLAQQSFDFRVSSGRRQAVDSDSTEPRKPPKSHRLAVVFGPNGSAKTNLILALTTFRDLVLHSAQFTDTQYAERYVPFHFGTADRQPTEFEVEVLLDGTRYRYGVAYDAERVLFERLLVYRTGKPQRWFEREYDAATQAERWAPFSPNFSGSREMWRRMTRSKALFLTTAARLECEQLQPLYRWFENAITVRMGTDKADLDGIAAAIRNGAMKTRILDILHAVDLPIRDIRISDHPAGSARAEFRYEVGGEVSEWVDSDEEAHGTLRLLTLLNPLLSSLDSGALMALDEFDAGLHPLLARFVVQFAKLTPVSEGLHPQFLFTSHDAALMLPEILEHDEIWLMECDRARSSHLLPVSDRGPRRRERLVMGYLRGRYGAIPTIHGERFF